MRLTDSQRRILEGLSLGFYHSVSASEMPEYEPLKNAGFIHGWLSIGGFMWRITDLGRAALAQSEDASRKRGE